jgi:hypothetical protein
VDLEILVRTFYFDDFLKSLKNVQPLLSDEKGFLVALEVHFKIIDITSITHTPIIQDSTIEIELKIESNFPREILCQNISLSFELIGKNPEIPQLQNEFDVLPFSVHFDYKQDNTLSGASIVCETKGKVRRTSSGKHENVQVIRTDFNHSASADNVRLHPGMNLILLKTKALEVGNWKIISKSLYRIVRSSKVF